MDPRDIPFTLPDGSETTLRQLGGRAFLVVNVASKCGFTPQYAGLEELNERYGEAGLTVVGFPCNQFLGQEPGSAAEIQEFCSLNYGVTFPLAAKLRVNGARKHPLYAELRSAKDADGKAGLVKWNFEKFLVAADGSVRRFRSKTEPQDPELIAAVEAALAAE
ncbi:glutathione peroxidase [Leucobacter luti]|uniref:glutathione peroxidase n=1 Tax=Leucobacter luti TaxID=340320 RepID=UPI003CFEB7B3